MFSLLLHAPYVHVFRYVLLYMYTHFNVNLLDRKKKVNLEDVRSSNGDARSRITTKVWRVQSNSEYLETYRSDCKQVEYLFHDQGLLWPNFTCSMLLDRRAVPLPMDCHKGYPLQLTADTRLDA